VVGGEGGAKRFVPGWQFNSLTREERGSRAGRGPEASERDPGASATRAVALEGRRERMGGRKTKKKGSVRSEAWEKEMLTLQREKSAKHDMVPRDSRKKTAKNMSTGSRVIVENS